MMIHLGSLRLHAKVSVLSSKRILVVDDDKEVRAAVAALLQSIGFDVTGVEGADAAIALLANFHPDAVLTDIHMAGGDGFELMNAIRNQGLDIPIIAMSGGSSGGSDTDYLELARKLGAVAVIDKPFRGSHLAEAIDRAIAKRGGPSRS